MTTIESLLDQVTHGDCLEVMQEVPDRSISLILADLPYAGLTYNHWDCLIPFDALWEQYKRIIKPSGVVVLTSMELFTGQVIMSNPSWFKYKMIWAKPNAVNFLNAKKQPMRSHEDICVFYKKQCTYNPQMIKGEPYKSFSHGVSSNYAIKGRIETINETGLRYPSDILYFNNTYDSEKSYHPTQKPVPLGCYLVRTYTNEGDIVLDNTCGSGSFLVAVKMENRHYIGIEKEEKYVKIARSRLAETTPVFSFG